MDKLMDMYMLMDKYMLKYMYSLICLGLLGFACLCLNVASKSSICLICLTLLDFPCLADGWRLRRRAVRRMDQAAAAAAA